MRRAVQTKSEVELRTDGSHPGLLHGGVQQHEPFAVLVGQLDRHPVSPGDSKTELWDDVGAVVQRDAEQVVTFLAGEEKRETAFVATLDIVDGECSKPRAVRCD